MKQVPDSITLRSERATLKDVARLAGVSDISVSRVMRDAPNTSKTLRDKVIKAANELGYTPNRLAGALKTSHSNLVAVVLPSMSNEVFPQVLDGIDSVLAKHGLCAVLGVSQYDPAREIEVVRELLSWSPMGIILTGLNADPAIVRMVSQQNIPVVQIMDIDGAAIQSVVGVSHRAAGAAAADYLFEKGYKQAGYIGAWDERPSRSKVRRQAFEFQLAEHGHPIAAVEISKSPSSALIGAQAVEKLLMRHPDVDCIFFANDDLAIGGLFHCLKAEISVPDNLAILGFNGIDLGKATPVRLTSIATPRFEMGARAAELLVRDDNKKVQIIDLGFTITSGESA